MGVYINTGNEGFRATRRSEFVDKSRLIAEVNRTIGTMRKLTFVSRPRRFGKSTAARMLCSYYDKSCDSSELFDDLEIAQDDSYEMHRNVYDVIYLDITNIIGKAGDKSVVAFITERLLAELEEIYPEVRRTGVLDEQLARVVQYTGNKFIAIIDEWDALMRDRKAAADARWEYLEFLRMLFKSSGTTEKIFAAAYMTGILPVKKDGSQSAISEFKEYTMLSPKMFAPYIGFTEEEVCRLCKEHDMSFDRMKYWYDGYTFSNISSIYNPNSVMEAVFNRFYESYWNMSSSARG